MHAFMFNLEFVGFVKRKQYWCKFFAKGYYAQIV